MSWHPQAYQSLIAGDYLSVQNCYEQLVETEPSEPSHYWYLGLSYLLTTEEEQAQTTWLLAMSQGEEEEIQQWTRRLIEILETEAQRQQEQENYELSWLIRAHIREIEPSLINNLLELIDLEIELNRFSPELLEEWEIVEGLLQSRPDLVNTELLLKVLAKILYFPAQQIIAFTRACGHQIKNTDDLIKIVMSVANLMAHENKRPSYAVDLTKICLELKPQSLDLLDHLFWFYNIAERFSEALNLAYQSYEMVSTVGLKLYNNYKILSILLQTGAWLEIDDIAQRHKQLLRDFIQTQPKSLEPLVSDFLQNITMPLFYLEDNPSENRSLINKISQLFSRNLENSLATSQPLSPKIASGLSQKLKIGYIGHTFRRHSVGWLCRWLFNYYNRENFEFIIYSLSKQEDNLTLQWFKPNAKLICFSSPNPQAIAHIIEKDKIDILVDLDSLTHNITCQVMALKPAPVQVTWLGLDGSGLPTIDYFIADPYVLPPDAQNYYQEKIFRLPTTYLAVSGFEVGVSTLKRQQLDIPDGAFVYLSVQTGLKRHPDTIRLQMKILKAVPDSYLLIKGAGNFEKIQQLFVSIASEEDVSPNRLRFLSQAPTEEIHRANLAIADVVLDTYPYNGATTTLEVLWMGIPLVTRVGEQFAARNSYTFMINAGLTEGIAWTDEEYIQWGVKLGTDERLRQQISWKLKNGRKTAPLWNAQQFTLDMENAYQQMWRTYLENNS
ncbi:hypothetical protein [Gloeothece verrucosa]|uniref:O-linked N-acetylglucosamine transferase SPINDLY family-like protein n=1 Tax=Gloeothece verrucosa (strain PCC 7822) TaxID=497965 RepID=E0U7R8_GLOV7|nr:hypothetical protein [Gloeothece verrucosa]ADN14880.1 O-linked N-acetylglucosamine transferase SPINDLY family-like protein [Gloeothece verrucosa PCC 7822]